MMKKENDISLFRLIKRIIPMTFAASPLFFIVTNIIGILHGVFMGINTVMTKNFFDSVNNLVKGEDIKKTILIATLLGVTLISYELLNGLHNFLIEYQYTRTIGYISKRLNEKAGRLDALAFENPSNLDDINKANEGVKKSMDLWLNITTLFTFYIPYFIVMGVYLYKLKPLLALSLVLIFIPVVLNQFIRVKIFTKLSNESGPIRREYEYYEKCIVDREYYKETRILGAFGYFKDLYVSTLKLLNEKIWIAEKKSGLIEILMKFITLVGYMGILYLLVYAVVKGDITVGAFGAVFASIGTMFSIMEEIVRGGIGRLTQNLGTINNLVRFLDMNERKGEEVLIEGVPSIVLENVSFTYPGAEKEAIKNINLEIKPKETIAIVGENGAGKTTLVSLMTGLYIPTKGKVLFGGFDTSKVSEKSLYNNISAVFQKFQRYKMSLGDNIAISNLGDSEKPSEVELNKAVKKANFEVDGRKFKDSFETMLSREFDGIDLSGGQWQRIAIARGFYKNHNTIILDEPTAAIDPVEETKIYRKFAEMSENKTSIIVTHRLGSAKVANRIVVMDDGGIVEIGTHEELMQNKGKYALMYEAQSKWYDQSAV